MVEASGIPSGAKGRQGQREGDEGGEGKRTTGMGQLWSLIPAVSPSEPPSRISFDLPFTAQTHIRAIKDRRAAKEEKDRYEKMAEKMHRKRVERLKRKEKRNKRLNA